MIERRELFPIFAAIVSAPYAIAADYRPRFFSESEYESLDRICEEILPTDDEAGGAHEARVAAYIDTLVFYSPAETQSFWKRGIADLGVKPGDPFFERLKAVTIDAYFQSPVGQKYMKYSGHAAKLSFPGCDHPDHLNDPR